MKRDLSIIRDILLRVEEADDIDIGCPEEVLAYHLLLLQEERFIRGIVVQEVLDGPPVIQQTMSYVRLTSAGHDFLDSIRDETVWTKTREKVATVGGGVALDLIVTIASQFVKERLGLSA